VHLDKPENILEPPVRKRQAHRGAVIAVLERVCQHRKGAVHEQPLDVFGQLFRVLEYLHQYAFGDAEFARLARYGKAGADVVTNDLPENMVGTTT